MWDERYDIEDYFYGRMPNDFLVSVTSHIPQGKVLCLAEGEGRNSVFLARSGYQVTGIDSSQAGIRKARQLAEQNEVSVEYLCKDLTAYEIEPNTWEGIVSIFCHFPPELRRQIHARAVDGLKSGGAFILESYSPAQLSFGTGGPKNASLLPDLPSLRKELEGLELIVSREIERVVMEGTGHSGLSAVVQVVGIKP